MRSPFHARPLALILALALGLAGCASSGGGSSDASPRGTTTRIVESELTTLQQFNVYDAIQRLRPNWLRRRGSMDPVILVDGSRQAGGIEILQSYRVTDVTELRYMSGIDATNRYGTGFDGGAILITTRRR